MACYEYLEKVKEMLTRAAKEQQQVIEDVIALLDRTFSNGGVLHVFGASHAGIITEELFYRAGGWIPVNPIFAEGLMLNTKPITKTSALERLHGYAEIVLEGVDFQPKDVLLVHSVSGRNALAIDIAMFVKAKNIPVVALTSVAFSSMQPSRHNSGLRLYEVADIILDNYAEFGDAAIGLPGSDLKVGPTSTVVGTALLQTIMVEVARRFAASGKPLPVFVSANVENGEEKNDYWLEKYKGRVNYI
ncbi:SIS domain-containing protein [Paenibacillus sp. IITD108]|uniref:SIS domain-containing protein n=1 Tax=Paenibacillus sp. IITD108 TaxID=3116649 RepID=UPI002F40C084